MTESIKPSHMQNSKVQYDREQLFKLKSDHIVEIITDLPFRRPRRIKRKLPPLTLEVTENAWSENRASKDEYEALSKSVLTLLNKLTMEKYDTICDQFIDLMKKHELTDEQLEDFIPKIYLIVLKMYNNTFARLFKKYNNEKFNSLIYDAIMKNFLISIGKIEDDRKISSLLEDPDQIRKRYALNNLSFIIDMYNIKLIDSKQFKYFMDKLMASEDLELICHLSVNFYKTHKNEMYDKIVEFLKTASKDKKYNSRLRFKCMDVLDEIY